MGTLAKVPFKRGIHVEFGPKISVCRVFVSCQVFLEHDLLIDWQ